MHPHGQNHRQKNSMHHPFLMGKSDMQMHPLGLIIIQWNNYIHRNFLQHGHRVGKVMVADLMTPHGMEISSQVQQPITGDVGI